MAKTHIISYSLYANPEYVALIKSIDDLSRYSSKIVSNNPSHVEIASQIKIENKSPEVPKEVVETNNETQLGKKETVLPRI